MSVGDLYADNLCTGGDTVLVAAFNAWTSSVLLLLLLLLALLWEPGSSDSGYVGAVGARVCDNLEQLSVLQNLHSVVEQG